HARLQLVEPVQERLGREAVGVGEQDHRLAELVAVGDTQDLEPVLSLLDLEVMGRDLGAWHRGSPDDGGRPVLDLTACADDAAGPATDQVAWLETIVDGRQDTLAVAQMGSARAQQAEIATR